VLAVAEPALCGQQFDVVEDRAEARIRVDQPDLADAGRVEDQPPARQQDELAIAGGVTPPRVAARMSWVAIRSSPSSVFTSVDFPTPDEPISTQVSPGAM
jgi:hypothetical protein